jgi:para-aminobenzoate synthetase / 4-amino-4-deoxychorismate lyase
MTLRVAAGLGPSLLFENPHHVWTPSTFGGALAALQAAQSAADRGYWIAGAISYEFGTQLHGIDARSDEPLLLLGAFEEPSRMEWHGSAPKFAMSAPLSRIARDSYAGAIEYLLAQIHDGEVYQVNYTVPFDAGFAGDPLTLFRFLAPRARAPYCAYLEQGDFAIVSMSPELFLRFDGDCVTTKPMKGTAPLAHLEELASSKNRAEHVMIVDLLRNDLHRICEDVRVRRLFEIERYPTFATMTSTITGRLRPQTSFERILRATFPCGSVTGAPKRAAIAHIARTEQYPRGFYTGTIGFLSPQRRGWWNVPIRTLQIDRSFGRARYDAGGGIVSDSNAADEWNEIAVKSRFLRPAYEGFSLWESFRGGPQGSDVQAHLRRLERSAAAFGIPLDMDAIRAQLVAPANMPDAQFVRIRASADSVKVTARPLERSQTPVDLCVSRHRVRSDDPLLRHKTAWRPVHEAAALEARERNCFDAILQNERGELTEGSRTNIFVQKGNTVYTPPLECGLLPGILRSQLVNEGQAVERVLTQADLAAADAVFAGNSARGLLLARIR